MLNLFYYYEKLFDNGLWFMDIICYLLYIIYEFMVMELLLHGDLKEYFVKAEDFKL